MDGVKARSMDAAQLSKSLFMLADADAEGAATKPSAVGLKSANVASLLAFAMASALFWAEAKFQLCPHTGTINGTKARRTHAAIRLIMMQE